MYFFNDFHIYKYISGTGFVASAFNICIGSELNPGLSINASPNNTKILIKNPKKIKSSKYFTTFS